MFDAVVARGDGVFHVAQRVGVRGERQILRVRRADNGFVDRPFQAHEMDVAEVALQDRLDAVSALALEYMWRRAYGSGGV